MLKKVKILRFTAVIVSVSALLFFLYHQYQTYKTDTQITRQQLRMNTLRAHLATLDESLTMSARLYVLTGAEEWKTHYQTRSVQYYSTFSEINTLLNGRFDGKKELQLAAEGLFRIEEKAIELKQENREAEAKLILFGETYMQHRWMFQAGLAKLATDMEAQIDQFMLFHQNVVLEHALVTASVILLILLGWNIIARLYQKWQSQLLKANEELHLLSAHLQEVQEKERLAIANVINEELGQQLAAIKVRIDLMDVTTSPPPQPGTLREVSVLLGTALGYLHELAANTYPLVLRDLGLVEALEWKSKSFTEQTGIPVLFSAEAEHLQLKKEVATALFRVYQEKLRTLEKNGATEIVCMLGLQEGRLVLTVYDNAPYTPQDKRIEDVAIEERLRNVNATLLFDDATQEGHTFTVSLPYRDTDNALLY